MQISISFIVWDEAQRRCDAGTLEDDLFDEDDPSKSWISGYDPANEWSDSALQYMAVGETYQAIAPSLESNNRQHCDGSIGAIIGPQVVIDDLNVEAECRFLAMKPSRVFDLAQNFGRIDFGPFPSLFNEHCPAEHRDILCNYDDDFKWYVDMWNTACSRASERELGILGYIG